MTVRRLNEEERKNVMSILKARGMNLSGDSLCVDTKTGKRSYNIGLDFMGTTYDWASLGKALKNVLADADEIIVDGIKAV